MAAANEIGLITFDGLAVIADNDPAKYDVLRAIYDERLDRLRQAKPQ